MPITAQLPPLGGWGYDASPSRGWSRDVSDLRGLFNRHGLRVGLSMITDGTSNTLMLGEALVAQNDEIRFDTLTQYGGFGDCTHTSDSTGQTNLCGECGWCGYDGGNPMGLTIVPINYPVTYDPNASTYCPTNDPLTSPDHDIYNWNVDLGFKSNHTGGTNFAFADGSVHFISQNIDHRTYQLLGCRNDGQVISGDY